MDSSSNDKRSFYNGRKSPPFSFTPAHETATHMDIETIVRGLLTGGGLSVVYGAPKSGKTFLAIDMALRVARGVPWHGRRTDGGTVLYLALEGGVSVERRVRAWILHNHADEFEVPEIPLAVVSAPMSLCGKDSDLERVLATAEAVAERFRRPVKLIVIDTLARSMAGGSENSDEDMGAVIQAADEIRAATGAHVMLIHHPGKDESRGMRGHSSLLGALDTLIEVTKDDQGRRAIVSRQRDLEEGDEFPFHLEVVEIGQDADGDPVTTCVAEAGGGDAAPKSPAFYVNKGARRAYKALVEALADPAKGRFGFLGMPQGIPTVTEDQWRDTFFGMFEPGEKDDTKRAAFRRGRKELMDGGGRPIVSMKDRRVWLTDHEMHATN